MHCFYHPKEEAAGQCIDCGKALCRSCFSRWNIPICDDCNYRRSVADENALDSELHILIILAIVGTIAVPCIFGLRNIYRIDLMVVLAVFLSGTYAGWKALSSISEKFFGTFFKSTIFIFPIVDLLFFGWLKLAISCFVGWLCLPFFIYRILQRKKQIREAQNKLTLLQ